jgi:glyoxylase-like metal-dependent hydrolase (beta-lactamase superfamily II)
VVSGCAVNLYRIQDPPRAVAVTTFEFTRSMIYVARTDSGAIVVDLGWTGAGRDLRRGLRRVGLTTEDVQAVFLTHSHRDHIRGWRVVRGATFYASSSEVPYLTGGQAPTSPHDSAPLSFPGCIHPPAIWTCARSTAIRQW